MKREFFPPDNRCAICDAYGACVHCKPDDAGFTLPNGTEIDPKSAWPLPGKVKE